MDNEKLSKINWERLIKHSLVEWFIKNPNREQLFQENLRQFRRDKLFLQFLGIGSLDEDEIPWLINQIKARYIGTKTGRRGFLKWLIGAGAATAITAGTAKHFNIWHFKSHLPMGLPKQNYWDDFLTYTEKSSIDKRRIEPLLYDVIDKKGTAGRAVHIGDGYFLTAYHVVNGRETSHKVIPQSIRGTIYSNDFKILHYDSDADIALLKVPVENRKGKPLVHLSPRILKVGENVSSFTRLSGKPLSQPYEYELYGKDYYDKKSDIKIGKFNLPAGSLLFETQGFVLVKNDSSIISVPSSTPSVAKSLKYSQFTSLMMYNADSGSPVFLRLGADNYILAGIVTSGLGIEHGIVTPNHPLKYKEMQQSGVIFADRDSIEKMIVNYNLKTKK